VPRPVQPLDEIEIGSLHVGSLRYCPVQSLRSDIEFVSLVRYEKRERVTLCVRARIPRGGTGRSLVGELSAESTMMPSVDVRARVLAQVKGDRAPTRGEVRARNAKLFVSALVVPLGVFLLSGGVRVDARPRALLAETSLGAAAVALTALIVALGRGGSMLGRPRNLLLGLVVVSPIAMLAWKLGASAQFYGMTDAWPERPGLRCLLLSCLIAAWPLVALVAARRGTDPVHPRLTGAALGSAVGACSWLLVDFWCPVAYVPHLLVGHVLPLVLCTVVGSWLGRFVALRRL
jgi:hypothetical protein